MRAAGWLMRNIPRQPPLAPAPWIHSGAAILQRRAFRSNSVHRAQKKPWYYEMNVIFSKEAREERARKIKEESTKGRFAELNEIKENGGKLFEADMEVLSLQDPLALPFPDLDAWPLVGADGGEPKTTEQLSARLAGKVTLVTLCVRDIARPMVSSWIDALRKHVGSHNHNRLQIVQLSFVEGAMYKMFRGMLLNSIKGRTADEDKAQCLVAFEDSESFRGKLGLKNRLVAYVFLVDSEKRVRWRGCGYALDHEIKAMCSIAASLEHERHVRSGGESRRGPVRKDKR